MVEAVKKVKKERNSNMDLLRIVSMFLIILLHSIDHSGVLEASETASLPIQVWVRFTYMLTQVCVNCFVLISGYFLVRSKFRLQKLIALWLETVFYSLIIRIVFIAIGYSSFSVSSILGCFVPVFTGRYWFITIYFGLYLVFPFLNIAINAMSRKQHLMLNIVLFFLFSVVVSVYPSFKGMNSGAGWGLAWFIVLYFIAAYVRLYYEPNGKKIRYLLFLLLIGIIVSICYVTVNGKSNILTNAVSNCYRYDSVFAYLSSICLLLFFVNVRINNKVINRLIIFIAPSVFGVYLIHAHTDFSLWSWEFLDLPSKMSSLMFIPIQLAIVIAIYAFCTVIDLVRRFTIGRIETSKLILSFSNSIEKMLLNFFKRFLLVR